MRGKKQNCRIQKPNNKSSNYEKIKTIIACYVPMLNTKNITILKRQTLYTERALYTDI